MADCEVPINNSAGRLVYFLKKAIEIGNKNRDRLYISSVCEAIGLQDNPTNRTESLSNLFYLIHQLEKDISLLSPTRIRNHQQTIAEVKNSISTGFTNKYSAIIQLNNTNSHAIRDLENCADSLSELVDLRVIEEEELAKLSDDINSLYQTINSSNIGKDLKFILLKKLTALKEAIENYQFQGSNGIEREVENTIGSIFLNQDKVNSDEEVSLVKKVFDLICKMITTVSAAKNILPEDWTEKIQNLLPSG